MFIITVSNGFFIYLIFLTIYSDKKKKKYWY